MAKPRGVMQMIFKSFIASLKPSPKPRLIGEDYNGTKYFEQEKREGGRFQRNHRYFEPPEKEDFAQDIPGEWEAWLRHRRKEAPSVEEVNKNYQTMVKTKENAAKLNQVYLESSGKVDQPKKEKIGTFPVYEEYKNHGEGYKVKE